MLEVRGIEYREGRGIVRFLHVLGKRHREEATQNGCVLLSVAETQGGDETMNRLILTEGAG